MNTVLAIVDVVGPKRVRDIERSFMSQYYDGTAWYQGLAADADRKSARSIYERLRSLPDDASPEDIGVAMFKPYGWAGHWCSGCHQDVKCALEINAGDDSVKLCSKCASELAAKINDLIVSGELK